MRKLVVSVCGLLFVFAGGLAQANDTITISGTQPLKPATAAASRDASENSPSPALEQAHREEASGTLRRPNVVLVLLDNVGYGDLGCYGNKEVKTPHLDALARQSVRCTDFYVGSPSCMPSRGALLTGRHPLRSGLNEQLWREPSEEQLGLPHRERLLPQYLHDAGYVSGCFGKWNIGFAPGSRPTERGFDEFFGHASGNMHYYNQALFAGRARSRRGRYATSRL